MAKTDEDPCKGCPGLCCRYVAVELDEPEDAEDWDEIKWMLHHKNLTVYKDNDGDWLVEFKTDCKNLDENGRCKIYDERPELCREHDPETCVRNGEGEVHVILFKTPEDVDKYLEEQEKKFREARGKKPLNKEE